MGSSAAKPLPDFLEQVAEDDGITPDDEAFMQAVIAKYKTSQGLDFVRMRADIEAGQHPGQPQP